jgi:hypothetical protein
MLTKGRPAGVRASGPAPDRGAFRPIASQRNPRATGTITGSIGDLSATAGPQDSRARLCPFGQMGYTLFRAHR